MQSVLSKSLGAVALAAASVCAHADGVSFYGLLDGGIATTSFSGSGLSGATEYITGGYAPNFVGATGSKDIGNGYTGGFKLEQGFLLSAPSSGSSRNAFGGDSVFNRQANLYLKGGFGTVTAGTTGNIAFSSVLLGDARFGSDYGSSLAAVVIDGGLNTVDSGAFTYTSPTMYNTTAAFQYVPQSASGSSSSYTIRHASRASVTYASGPLKATVAGYTTERSDLANNHSGAILGATYKIGDFDLKGLYTNQKVGSSTGYAYNNLTTVGFGGAYFGFKGLTLDAGIYSSAEYTAGYKMTTFGLGAQYALAPGMTAYAQYANVKNTGSTGSAYAFVGDTQTGFVMSAGQTASTFNVGLLYSF